jgi:hypothetical protein
MNKSNGVGGRQWMGKGLRLIALDFPIQLICNSHVVTHRK